MKRLMILAALLSFVACQQELENNFVQNTENSGEELVVYGYASTDETRTAFGEPTSSEIPFRWTKGDYIYLGKNKSSVLTEDTTLAQFTFKGGTAVVGTGHIFYNMTGVAKTAKVLIEQTADGNLGNDGDFGYATLDEYNSFYLEHKTAYLWFDTKTTDSDMPKLASITLETEGVAIAGDRIYDFNAGEWDSTTTNSSSVVTLNFADGHELKAANEGVMAAMVLLPAEVAGTTLTVTYTFEDGRTYTEVKNPSKNFVSGGTMRIATTINSSDLTQPEPELPYELRVLTFEDKDVAFESYWLDYADDCSGREITKWSELVDKPQYGGSLLYGNGYASTGFSDAAYNWYDENNTNLYHHFPDNGFGGMENYNFAAGGHAISNYWGAGYADEDRNDHIAKYYGQDYIDTWTGVPGADQALGWFCVQLLAPIAPHSGDNFCVHYGYKDEQSYIVNLPELSFGDEVARVIDHMYVTNTNYTLNQLYNGVKSEEGNTFGGSWEGLTDDAWLKIVAYGYDSFDADPVVDEPTSTTEFWLVKGYQVVETWEKWDLSVLGKVAKVRFNFLYSDEMGGKYGFTIPGYFAYDDIAVRFEK